MYILTMKTAQTLNIPILLYHRIDNPPAGKPPHAVFIDPPAFEGHLRWLRRLGWEAVTAGTLTEHLDRGTRPDRRSVCICFDDGHRDNLRNALPILQKYRYPATVFAVAGAVGKALHFDYSEPEGDHMMTADELLELADSGVEIQSHGMSHARLTDLSDEEVFAEMRDSKQILEDILKRPVTLFAYPYGSVRPSFAALAKRAGYRAAFSTYRGRAHKANERYFLKRISVLYQNERTPWQFLNHLVIKSYARSQKKLDLFLRDVPGDFRI